MLDSADERWHPVAAGYDTEYGVLYGVSHHAE